jgi:hypothetical protein
MIRRTLMKLSFVAIIAAQLLTVIPAPAGAQEAAPGGYGSPASNSVYTKVGAHVGGHALPAPSLPGSVVDRPSLPWLPWGPRCIAASVHVNRLAFSPLSRPDEGSVLPGLSAPAINQVGCSQVIM